MPVPVVIVSSCSEYVSRDIIMGIVKNDSTQIMQTEEKFGILWNISNKYYNANVCLTPFPDGHIPHYFNEDIVEGVIIYINNFHGESLVNADQRKKACGKALQKSEMNILLCDKCNDTLPMEQATVWCLENDFQLVQLLEEPDTNDDSSPIKDHYGMERVIHTLHTNIWSNHEMNDVGRVEDIQHDRIDGDHELFDGDDDLEHMDEFCRLFSQMSSVSQNAVSMPGEERKAYAEQVVKAFWKAIDGDDSELEDNITME